MTRWNFIGIELGVEKSGTGIEKSGTGIEKSGTGIEKSGTGIEKSGTGLRKLLAISTLSCFLLGTQLAYSNQSGPAGTLSIVVNQDKLAVSWIIDGNLFAGVSRLSGSFTELSLTELSVYESTHSNLNVVGGGTGKEVVGGGTGVNVVGGGTGVNVVGGGTGVNVVGGGTGVNVVGGGTGVNVVGGGTGVNVVGGGTGGDVVGGGTGNQSLADGSNTLVVGGGTGSDAIKITLPGGTDMQMEVSLGCNSADVTILDGNFVEVVSFSGVPAIGASAYCHSNRADYPLLAGNFELPGDFERDK